MRFLALLGLMTMLAGCGSLRSVSSDGLVKVLPHFLDEDGRHSHGPLLLDRDLYQSELRSSPELIKAVRYDVNWYGGGELKLRLEVRSSKANVKPLILEETVQAKRLRSHWTSIEIGPEQYTALGQPESWRVTLWRGEEKIAEQKSFLW
tara:strand:+ start:423 stop:869 length:447 start_codon:yes stop_codon:yes gene_type:complete